MYKYEISVKELYAMKSLEEVREYFRDKTTEADLAEALKLLHCKSTWYDDIIYDYEVGTTEYLEALKIAREWFKLEHEFEEKVYSILRSEGIRIPNTRRIYVQEIFMHRNGYENTGGWWEKREPTYQEGAEDIYVIMEEEPHPTVSLEGFRLRFLDKTTERDYVDAYAIACNKFFWFIDEEYGHRNCALKRQIKKVNKKWENLMNKYRLKLFDIVKESVYIDPEDGMIEEYLYPLMKKYGYSHISGWWVNPEDKSIKRIIRVPRT